MLLVLHDPLARRTFRSLTAVEGAEFSIPQHLQPRPLHFTTPPLFVPRAWFFRLLTWHLMLGPTFFTKVNNFPAVFLKLVVCLKPSSLFLIQFTMSSSAWKVDTTRSDDKSVPLRVFGPSEGLFQKNGQKWSPFSPSFTKKSLFFKNATIIFL